VQRAIRQVVGADLVGVKGATPADQASINRQIARQCGAGILTPAQCRQHGQAIEGVAS